MQHEDMLTANERALLEHMAISMPRNPMHFFVLHVTLVKLALEELARLRWEKAQAVGNP